MHVQVSTACGLSVEMARIAVQTTCKALYKHEYFLNVEEVQNDQSDEDFEPVPKRPKKSVTKEDLLMCHPPLVLLQTISNSKCLK